MIRVVRIQTLKLWSLYLGKTPKWNYEHYKLKASARVKALAWVSLMMGSSSFVSSYCANTHALDFPDMVLFQNVQTQEQAPVTGLTSFGPS